jgi:peptidoglycan hydrolase-like protein with peptidoglycan-binding domain
MWGRWVFGIGSITAISVVPALVSPQIAIAERQTDYTPGEFRSALYGLGYNIPQVGGTLNDPMTQQAIRSFQRQHQLPVDGKANPRTQDTLAEIIINLQQDLNTVLQPEQLLPENQFYGPLTEELVREFQRQFNLPVTGMATPEVRILLTEQASQRPSRNNRARTRMVGSNTPEARQAAASSSVLYESVEQFRQVLIGLGYDIPERGPLDDAATQRAIRDLQQEYELNVTGTANPATQRKAAEVIKNLQNNLNLVVDPQPPLPLNQFYNEQVEAAVTQFQRQNNLPTTGIATLQVRQQLDNLARNCSRNRTCPGNR